MSEYGGMPSGYAEIFEQLDKLNLRSSNIASNATKYRSIADKSREGLNQISGKVQELAEIIKALKGLLANLSRTNVDLQTRLDEINRACDAKVARAIEEMQQEIQGVRQKCEEEKQKLQEETIGAADMEKRKALAELDQQAKAEIARIQEVSNREIERIKSEQINLNERILKALKSVARNQEIVISGLEKALTGNPDELNSELSSIQQQVLALLESLKLELETSMTGTLPPAPVARAREPEPLPRAQTTEIQPNYFAPDIDFNTPIMPLPATSNNDEKFVFALKKLYTAHRNGTLNEDLSGRYNWSVIGPFNEWKRLRTAENVTADTLLDKKRLVLKNTMSLYNDVFSPEKITIQFGGSKTRRHRKVHFKTRGGGKKRGKRTKRHKKAKRSHTKRH